MKQETKELVDWIKKQINIAKTNNIDSAWNGRHEGYNADYDRAMTFLDSLPEIEAHLCKGGYIQDRNGTPCCDGDTVILKDCITGKLIWNKEISRFQISYLENGCSFPFGTEFYTTEIEKVEI